MRLGPGHQSREAPPQTDEMEGSELGDLECDSVQVENNRARSARFSYRFGSPSGRIIAKPFRLPFRTPFSPGRCPGLLSYAPSARKTLNLTCRLPSCCGPLWSNPIFGLFVAFVAKKIRIGNRRPAGTPPEETKQSEPRTRPEVLETDSLAFPPPFAKASEGRPRAGAILRTGGRAHPDPLVGTDTESKRQSVPGLGNLTHLQRSCTGEAPSEAAPQTGPALKPAS